MLWKKWDNWKISEVDKKGEEKEEIKERNVFSMKLVAKFQFIFENKKLQNKFTLSDNNLCNFFKRLLFTYCILASQLVLVSELIKTMWWGKMTQKWMDK